MGDQRKHRIIELDGLRGIAICAVMLFHFVPVCGGSGAFWRWANFLASAGWMGVDLFFVLSGFLITGILLDTRDGENYFKNFYARRTLRIFPLYYGVLFVILGVVPLFSRLERTSDLFHNAAWFWLYATNFLVTAHGFAVTTSPHFELGHFWTLAVEEQFYLSWPLLVYLLPNRRVLLCCFASILLAGCSRTWFAAHDNYYGAATFTLSRMDTLAIGAIGALIVRTPNPFRVIKSVYLAGYTLLAIIFAIFVLRRSFSLDTRILEVFGFPMLDFGALAVLVSSVFAPQWLSSLLKWRPLRLLGQYSYGLYVFHVLFAPTILRQRWFMHQGPFVKLSILLLISTALAMASWHLYEKHFLNLKRIFDYCGPGKRAIPQTVAV